MPLDITDLVACKAACEGMDIILHLAAYPSPFAEFYDALLPNNIQGTYNVFAAAATQRCQRVIFASSIMTMQGYPLTLRCIRRCRTARRRCTG
jgi:nucleoside-diphosphate-sugar epimerase